MISKVAFNERNLDTDIGMKHFVSSVPWFTPTLLRIAQSNAKKTRIVGLLASGKNRDSLWRLILLEYLCFKLKKRMKVLTYLILYELNLLLYRYDSAENWSSDINKNCILSTAEISPLAQRNLITNDKDWDLYNYDRSSQTCRNSFPDSTTKRGNNKSQKY